jgi:hypothetical protein
MYARDGVEPGVEQHLLPGSFVSMKLTFEPSRINRACHKSILIMAL